MKDRITFKIMVAIRKAMEKEQEELSKRIMNIVLNWDKKKRRKS